MNLRDLEYVVAVAEEGHFGRAAENCHVSQPALSGQIKKLEDRLGVKLFERTNRRVSVTLIGTEIVAMAKRLLLIADEITDAATASADPLAGLLRFGTIPTIGPYLLPSILRPIKQALPKVQFTLSEDFTRELERKLVTGELDVAVTATDIKENGLDEIPLYDEPFVVAMPVGHSLDTGEDIDVTTLGAADLLLLKDGHCLSDQVARLCGLARKTNVQGIDTQSSSLETIVGLVAAGEGVTFLPASMVAEGRSPKTGMTIRAATNKAAQRRVRLIFRETFPKRELLAAICRVISEHLPKGVSPL